MNEDSLPLHCFYDLLGLMLLSISMRYSLVMGTMLDVSQYCVQGFYFLQFWVKLHALPESL